MGVLDYLIDIHTGEISDLPINFLFSTPFTVSPDRTREVGINVYTRASWQGVLFLDAEEYDRRDIDGVVNLVTVDWFLDSSQFVGIDRYELISNKRSVYIIDRNGNLLTTVFNIESEQEFFRTSLSPSNRHYIFSFIETGWMIADIQQEVIYDLCLENSLLSGWYKLTWSPDSRQIALGRFSDDFSPFLIFDLDDWEIYQTDIYHDGNPMMWVDMGS